MAEITIVVADDHHVVLRGVRALLEVEPDFRIVGEAHDGLEALQAVERLRPRVLVIDLVMPGLNGVEVVRRARRISPRLHVVVLSMYADEAHVVEALRAGATAYVLKSSRIEELVTAVRETIAGRRYLSAPLSERFGQTHVQSTESMLLDPYAMLTDREREILQLTAEGHSRKSIAAKLCISPRTAEVHRANLMRKLGLRRHTDIVRYAYERGILLPKS